MGFQEGLPVMATVLTPLVGMDNDGVLGFRRHTAINKALIASSLSILERIDQPTT